MNNACRINLLLVLFVILLSLDAFSYPLYIRIENPRNNPLIIHSPLEKTTTEIAPENGAREFLVCGPSDFRVQYASGFTGICYYNLDETLNTFIEGGCKRSMGDNWSTQTLKYCTLRLDEKKCQYSGTTYGLTVTEVKDLKIDYTSEQCMFSANEKALKVSPFSATHELLSPEIRSKMTTIFNLNK